jgi:hypothetical protein
MLSSATVATTFSTITTSPSESASPMGTQIWLILIGDVWYYAQQKVADLCAWYFQQCVKYYHSHFFLRIIDYLLKASPRSACSHGHQQKQPTRPSVHLPL